MKHENKCKRKAKKVLPALEEKNVAKILEENDKNFARSLVPIKQRENMFWKSLNSEEHVRNKGFKKKKIFIRFSIDRKISLIDRNT